MLFTAVTLKAQIEGNFCHNKARQLNCASWLNYILKFAFLIAVIIVFILGAISI